MRPWESARTPPGTGDGLVVPAPVANKPACFGGWHLHSCERGVDAFAPSEKSAIRHRYRLA
mgnify:CR=1 FL=1